MGAGLEKATRGAAALHDAPSTFMPHNNVSGHGGMAGEAEAEEDGG